MAKGFEYIDRVGPSFVSHSGGWLAMFCVALASVSPCAHAQEVTIARGKCATTIECAEQMVTLANNLLAENAELRKRVASTENELATQSEALKTVRKDFDALRNSLLTHQKAEGLPLNGAVNNSDCPDGMYVVGVFLRSVMGGAGMIQNGFVKCRPLLLR
ncbi:hypothetical protein [Rhizobium ruizarguesonis]|nr:hypothetical protein [Rhizobium ruizarguesonis]TBC12695.1 hypothetical protein ELH35_37965 [Rhizobium ruizarguesonis]